MIRDPDYNKFVYQNCDGDAAAFLVRVKHPKTKLHIFFEGNTRFEAVEKAEEFWAKHQEERERNWAAQEAAKLKRKEKK